MTQHDGITPAGADEGTLAAAPPAPDSTGGSVPPTQHADAPPPTASANDDLAPVTTDEVRAALRRVKDPELNLNIVDLGLIYDIAVDGSAVKVDMSLTSPGCPSGPEIMRDAENAVKATPGVTEASINLVWSPIWTPERIEPRVRAYMGF